MGKRTFGRFLGIVAVLTTLLVIVASLVSNRHHRDPYMIDGELGDALAKAFEPGPEVSRPRGSLGVASLLPATRRDRLSATEIRLLGILPDPGGLSPTHRLSQVTVSDPTDALHIGERWFAPKVLVDGCSTRLDEARGPRVAATYYPGDPDIIVSSGFPDVAVVTAPHQIAVEVQVLDDVAQRDAAFSVRKQALAQAKSDDCPIPVSSIFAMHEVADAPPLGRSRVAYRLSGPLKQWSSLVAVGDRILLTVAVSASPDPTVTSDAADVSERLTRDVVAVVERASAAL